MPIPQYIRNLLLRVGNTVHISKARRTFKKGYLPHWREEMFTIMEWKETQPPTFVLADYSNEVFKGTFYPQELQKVTKTNDIYRVEKILKRTKNRVFVQRGGRGGEGGGGRGEGGWGEGGGGRGEGGEGGRGGDVQTNSPVGCMWKISCDFLLIIVVLFVNAVLLMIFLMKEAEALSFGEDYMAVKDYINSSTKISSSVWWRMLMQALGVVLVVMCPNRKSFTSAKPFWFSVWWLLVFIIWPISKEISSCGWHFWVVVWAISYSILPSNHEWFLSHFTLQQLHGVLSREHSGTIYEPFAQSHQSLWRLGSGIGGNPISP